MPMNRLVPSLPLKCGVPGTPVPRAISVLEIFPLKVAIIHMGSFFCVFLRLSPDRVSQRVFTPK